LNALGAFVTKYNGADSKGNNDFEKRREAWGIQCTRDKTLRAIDLRMVMALQSFLNRETFAAFPSIQKLMRLIGCSETAARNSLKILAGRRHIRVQRRFRCREQRTNLYHAVLHLDTMQRIDAIRAERYTTPLSGFDTTPLSGNDITPSSGFDTLTSYLTSTEPPKEPLSLTGVGCANASASGSKESKREAWQGEFVARPYDTLDVEVIQQILNGSETTFAGLMNAARLQGALSDGGGIEAPALRAALNDLSALRLVGAEKRGRHVYYFMTGYGADLSDRADALGLSRAA
jgi:hypothetical protein